MNYREYVLELGRSEKQICIYVEHIGINRWGNSGNSVRLYLFWAPKSLHLVIAAMKLKDAYTLEGKL